MQAAPRRASDPCVHESLRKICRHPGAPACVRHASGYWHQEIIGPKKTSQLRRFLRKLLNPYGADVMLLNGRQASNYSPLGPNDKVQSARGGGIEWTIKDGIPYHVPTLMREVKDMVAKARLERRAQTTAGQ